MTIRVQPDVPDMARADPTPPVTNTADDVINTVAEVSTQIDDNTGKTDDVRSKPVDVNTTISDVTAQTNDAVAVLKQVEAEAGKMLVFIDCDQVKRNVSHKNIINNVAIEVLNILGSWW